MDSQTVDLNNIPPEWHEFASSMPDALPPTEVQSTPPPQPAPASAAVYRQSLPYFPNLNHPPPTAQAPMMRPSVNKFDSRSQIADRAYQTLRDKLRAELARVVRDNLVSWYAHLARELQFGVTQEHVYQQFQLHCMAVANWSPQVILQYTQECKSHISGLRRLIIECCYLLGQVLAYAESEEVTLPPQPVQIEEQQFVHAVFRRAAYSAMYCPVIFSSEISEHVDLASAYQQSLHLCTDAVQATIVDFAHVAKESILEYGQTVTAESSFQPTAEENALIGLGPYRPPPATPHVSKQRERSAALPTPSPSPRLTPRKKARSVLETALRQSRGLLGDKGVAALMQRLAEEAEQRGERFWPTSEGSRNQAGARKLSTSQSVHPSTTQKSTRPVPRSTPTPTPTRLPNSSLNRKRSGMETNKQRQPQPQPTQKQARKHPLPAKSIASQSKRAKITNTKKQTVLQIDSRPARHHHPEDVVRSDDNNTEDDDDDDDKGEEDEKGVNAKQGKKTSNYKGRQQDTLKSKKKTPSAGSDGKGKHHVLEQKKRRRDSDDVNEEEEEERKVRQVETDTRASTSHSPDMPVKRSNDHSATVLEDGNDGNKSSADEDEDQDDVPIDAENSSPDRKGDMIAAKSSSDSDGEAEHDRNDTMAVSPIPRRESIKQWKQYARDTNESDDNEDRAREKVKDDTVFVRPISRVDRWSQQRKQLQEQHYGPLKRTISNAHLSPSQSPAAYAHASKMDSIQTRNRFGSISPWSHVSDGE